MWGVEGIFFNVHILRLELPVLPELPQYMGFAAARKCSSFQMPGLKVWSYLAGCWLKAVTLGEIPVSMSVLRRRSAPALLNLSHTGLGLKLSPLSHCAHINSRAAFGFTGAVGFVSWHEWMVQPENTGRLPGENGRRRAKKIDSSAPPLPFNLCRWW